MLRLLAGDSSFRHLAPSSARYRRGVTVAIAAACLAMPTAAHAGISLRAGGMSGMSKNGSSSASATSQTATAATDNTSQTVTTSAGAQQAQASLAKSVQALQAMQAAQIAARNAAVNGANNLGLNPNNPGQTLPNVTDGLGGGAGLTGGLVPTGTLTATSTPSVQIIKLGSAGNNTLNLTSGGTVVVPEGTAGSDSVTVTGPGSVTSTGGSVTANAGSLTTSSGATLSSLQGGSISLTGGSATLSVVTTTNLTSSLAGTITVPNGGGQFALAAGTATTIPAGSTISFSGTGAGTVTIASSIAATTPSTVTLKGAGTLTLDNTPAGGSGGTITTSTGVASFSSGVTTTLPAGSTISLTGAGALSFAGAANDTLSVLLNTGQNGTLNGTGNFTTTGSLLSTTSFNVPSSWILGTGGALSQSFDSSIGHYTDTVTQEQQQALLYWSSFNIGKNTTLSFDQSAGGANVAQWVAINEITNPTLNPTQILGAIKAPGQVYVIDQNGIIFGGSSQVNVGALTASSLALNPDYINNGLLNDTSNNYEFQFSSLFTTTTTSAGTTVAPLWTAPPATTATATVTVASVPTGNVTVQAGAQLSSPTNPENQGGRIALIGPNVTNAGTISTPDGQTILAAGLQVAFSAHNGNDPSLRGLDTYVGQVQSSATTLPTGTFTFNGLPNATPTGTGASVSFNAPITFAGSGQVGTYRAPGASSSTPIMAGTATIIPLGSTVILTSGLATFAAVGPGAAGVATNAANTLDGSGTIVTPGGDIEAPRADVTLTGQTVNQMGFINGSTSVTLNGRIDLLADYNDAAETIGTTTSFFPFSSGDVNLGGQSVTQILPETSSSVTTIGTQLAYSSLVNIQGLDVDFSSGSLLYAPNASAPPSSSGQAFDLVGTELTAGVTVNAGSWFAEGSNPGQTNTAFSNDSGQITLETGATIDVSGSENVSASVAEDIIPVQLRGPQLADSPLQREGSLRGTTVYVDVRDTGVYDGTPWIGSPIGDLSGYANNIGRTVGELTDSGGSVVLNAGSSVAVQSGAQINVSGGWINYAGANVSTTKVISGGELINISQATPNLLYEGIEGGYTASSSKWGVSQTFINSLLTSSQYDAGYVQGGNGGTLTIKAPTMTLSGNFYGNTVEGSQQRTPDANLNSIYGAASFLPTTLAISGMPKTSQFNVSFVQASVDLSPNVLPSTSPNVEFQTDAYISQNAPAANQVLLSQDLVNTDGFGVVAISTTSSGDIVVPQDVSLTAVAGGSISFAAANIDIEGNMSAPGGGSLTFKVLDVNPSILTIRTVTPTSDPTRGNFTLGPDASLTAEGLLVDDQSASGGGSLLPEAITGGSISISGLNVQMAVGSSVNVSGGAYINASGQVTYGNAGSITLHGGVDPAFGSLVQGGELFLGSVLSGYSGAVNGAGSLNIQSPLVQIGGSSLVNGDSSAAAMINCEPGLATNGTTLWLDPSGSSEDFFSEGGFGNFTIEGLGQDETKNGSYVFDSAGNPVVSPAVLITAETALHPIVAKDEVQLEGNTAELVPLSASEDSELLPAERTAVNLTFDAEGIVSSFGGEGGPLPGGGVFSILGGGLVARGDIVLQTGASIVTDPQTNSSRGVALLAPEGTVAVMGTIVAPGGTINIEGGNNADPTSNNLLFYNSSLTVPFATVDLAPGSLLSTAGVFERSENPLGYATGSVLGGGNIEITGNIVGDQGAMLDASGASAILDESPAASGRTANALSLPALNPALVESNGGSITLNATQLLYNDATMLAEAGGPSAQGGTLTVSSGPGGVLSEGSPPLTPQSVMLIVTQQGLNGGFSVPSDALAGPAVLGQTIPSASSAVGATINSAISGPGVFSYFAADPNLFASTSVDSAASDNGGKAGGFGTLNLPGSVAFVGQVDITTSNSISVAKSSGSVGNGDTGGVIYANSAVVLTAPYVALNSYSTSFIQDNISNYPSATAGAGSLVIDASVLADVGNLSLADISTLTFNSGAAPAGDIRGVGVLQVAGQINLNAAQIYPPTESTFTIEGDDVDITAPAGQTLPALPLSAGGTLNIEANSIEQSGVLRAPFGTINLGTSATGSVTLSANSITSVSGVDPTTGVGITVPYGIVDASGNWFDPQGNNITQSGPPAKAINILGKSVQLEAGSTVDVSGGGNLYAYQFNSGTGGTQDILASSGAKFSSTSFAIIPGYSLKYAPDGTYGDSSSLLTNNTQDVGYYNGSLAVGEQIYLNGSNGLPAGYYTLLPARYATLAGAYLITPESTSGSGASVKRPDGSSVVSGYVTSSLNPTSSPVFGSFQVSPQSLVLSEAPYASNLANTYFPASAASNGLATPRLPVDSGQLVLDASESLNVQGTLLSQPGSGGLGSEVDIASSEPIYITGPNSGADVPATGVLVLDSSQLTGIGASSLLIGGIRSTTADGTSIAVSTDTLVVDNSGATTEIDGQTVDGLAAPDIILVSNQTLEVAANSEIEQFGKLSGSAQALTLEGDGALLRVSSDASAQTVRQDVVAGDTTSKLSIGPGVQIINAEGGAVGTLVLDSTFGLTIGNSGGAAPVLRGTSLSIDSYAVNLELGQPATPPTSGLVIDSSLLQSLLSSTQSLSILSYSAIALYGSGQIGTFTVNSSGDKTYQEASLSLHADAIFYADTQASTGIAIDAQTVSIDNLPGGTVLPPLTGLGTATALTINAQTITLGSNSVSVEGFNNVELNADGAILLKGLGATSAASPDAAPEASGLTVGGNIALTTPLITGVTAADQAISSTTTTVIDEAITATGAVTLQAPVTDVVTSSTPTALASILTLTGSSITQNSGSIVLNSGSIALQADGASGSAGGANVTIDGTLDVSGVAPTFYNLNKFTGGGQISLASLNGNVSIGSSGLVNISAASGAGTADSLAANGGSLSISAAGAFTPGKIEGQGGTVTQSGTVISQGVGGTFALDVGTLNSTGPGAAVLSSLESDLAGFSSQSIRDRDDTTVTVDGTTAVGNFGLTVDQGSILVSGTINASNVLATDPEGTAILVGGNISLDAGGSITLSSTAILNASGQKFSNAGEGGSVTLEAGSYEGTAPATSTASIEIDGGQIILGVGGAAGGTLHLRAPQVANGSYTAGSTYTTVTGGGGVPTDVAIAPIATGLVQNASDILVEGFYAQDAKSATALIGNYESAAETNASNFMNNAAPIASRIFGNATSNVNVQPGEEIDNSVGSLVLASTWNLSTLRYGAPLLNSQGQAVTNAAGHTILSEPGILTLRAAGDITLNFGASITDGFDGSTGVSYLNPLLPVGSQSWSYNITSGADFSSASTAAVLTPAQVQSSGRGGSLQVGYQDSSLPVLLDLFDTNSQSQFFQTIRTGTGNITINSGGDVLLLNDLATIYTAGSQVDPKLGGTFTPPSGDINGKTVPATYSDDGGNVSITAQGNIEHLTYSDDGSTLVADSSAEMPTSWLDREGSVSGGQVLKPTTWWIDFSNFFEGVGALGGGNVTLAAGGSVVNVDAAIPTNARLVSGNLNELGGGDLTVTAGVNIDGGVYYVERGQGTLTALGNIQTNATRAAVEIGEPSTTSDWLPTTLFLGQGSFSLQAGGNLLFGPVANAFLLPQSYYNIASVNNPTTEISFFSTYASTDAVNATSLGGSVTIQSSADSGAQGSLFAWYTGLFDAPISDPLDSGQISGVEPWLLLAESVTQDEIDNQIGPVANLPTGSPQNVFGGVSALLPPTLRATAFQGDINVVGSLTLAPSAIGTVDLVADGSINAFAINSQSLSSFLTQDWGSGLINLSDADPGLLPSVSSPYSSGADLLGLDQEFTETGATEGITLQTKEDLHADIQGETLHANDPTPAYIYAATGDISGLTLFSAKQTQLIAGQDITDVGLYIQNNNAADISIVQAGVDIIPYDAASPLRLSAGINLLGYNAQDEPEGSGPGAPNTGDIQISGPGALEVLAGRNITLGNDDGITPNNSLSGDGLYAGVTSVGDERDSTLGFDGANIIAAAGLGSGLATGLGLTSTSLDFASFINDFLNPANTSDVAYLDDLAPSLGLANTTDPQQISDAFKTLAAPGQDTLALDIFYLVLRDAGRDHNNSASSGFGNYDIGYAAISDLFPSSSTYQGNIDITSREIKTANNSDIDLLTPGGQVTVGINVPGSQAVDQGILTVDGGNISVFASGDVNVGTSRIFTLHGGNEIIWSTKGNIDAGASSKTVVSAPPTRVIVDPTSGAVSLDLAGLATGGGIGVLATVVGAPPGDVDLIAPTGIVDAGDAGIRASGNLNIAAAQVLNASNISVGGKSTGVPTGPSVNIGALAAASSAAGSSEAAAGNAAGGNQQAGNSGTEDVPSIITVEVLGFGGDEND